MINSKRSSVLLISLAAMLIFTGCRENVAEAFPQPEITPPGLKQIKVGNYTLDFFYDDAMRRVDKVIVNFSYDNGSGLRQGPEATYTFDYDENNLLISAFADREINPVLLINTDARYYFSYTDNKISAIEIYPVDPISLPGTESFEYDSSGNLISVNNSYNPHEFEYINHLLNRSKAKDNPAPQFNYKFSKYKNPTNSLPQGVALMINKYLYFRDITPAISLQKNFLLAVDNLENYNDSQFYILESKYGYPTRVQLKSQFYSGRDNRMMYFEYVGL